MLKIVSRLFLISIMFFIFSCAPKRIEVPEYEGIDIRDVIESRNSIKVIETSFSIIFEKDDAEIRGDGVLNIIKNGDLSLRVYSFGFLAFEMISENGIIKSNPIIDKNKTAILTYGLRDCLFWWDIKESVISEKDNFYLLRNLSRELWIDRKTMLPVKQKVFLDNGMELNMYYENPEKADDIWYPSKIRIELSKYAVTLKIRDMSFTKGVYSKVNSNCLDD